MRILFTRFPLESALGGAEIQTLSLMEGLAKRDHAVAFLGSCPTLLRECRTRGIPTVELQIGAPPVTKLAALTFAWRKSAMRRKLQAALSNFSHLDAVFMLSLSEKLLATDLTAAHGTKVFWVEHDRVGAWLSKNPWLSQLRTVAKSATTICVSDLSKKMYVELGWPAKSIVAIPNGIDLQRFSSTIASKQPSADGSLHLGCVARLSPEKGVDVLIHAVADLPEVSLTIVGTGREEGFLRKLIAEMQEREHLTEPRIKIVSNTMDLGDFYHSIDALVLPSREHDPFGLTAAEAMSVGVPVIVTDACGIAGYLRDGEDALIVRADDVEALKNAMQKMLDSALRTRIGERGRDTARRQFDVTAMIDRYEQLIVGVRK